MCQVPLFALPPSSLARSRFWDQRISEWRRVRRTRPQRATLSTPSAPASLGVPNLRDVCDAAPHLQARRGALLRGSAPSICGDEAHSFLSDVWKFIDLRTRDEQSTDPRERMLGLCGSDFYERVHSVPLLNRRRVIFGLAKVLPREQVHGLVAHSLRSPGTFRKAIVRKMDTGGLYLLNRILLEAGGRAITRALRIVTQSLREQRLQVELAQLDVVRSFPVNSSPPSSTNGQALNHSLFIPSSLPTMENEMKSQTRRGLKPVYIFCSAGKDRTGLLVALILSVLGASEDEIIRDYVKSAETWENGPYSLRQEYSRKLEHNGLTPKTWLVSSADIMEQTLTYICDHYGSVEAYLSHAGFDEGSQDELRRALR